jgi:hypothetical protein
MSASSPLSIAAESHLVLRASYRKWDGALVPEQSASFDITLENRGALPVETLGIESNQWNPTLRVFNEDGSRRFETPAEVAAERYHGHTGEPTRPPRLLTLQPGQSKSTFVNLCKYADPLPPGRYFFQAAHKLQAIGGGFVSSEKIPFTIEPARVLTMAAGYDAARPRRSSLAWIAVRGTTKPQLLIRWSGKFHATTMWGGMFHGEAPPDTALSVSQVVQGATTNELGWVAVHWPGHVEMIQHNMSAPFRRTGPLEFPISAGFMVPRFPDRGTAALAMVAGVESDGRSALAGVLSARGAINPKVWKQRLVLKPFMAACSFEKTGPITVLLASERQGVTRISRIGVDEDGWLIVPEHVVHTTFNKVLAIASDPRGFLVLEAHPIMTDHLTRIRIPLNAEPEPPVSSRIAGWPNLNVFGVTIPLPPDQLSFEPASDGSLWLAFTDPRGGLFAGDLNKNSVSLYRPKKHGQFVEFPHVSALVGHLDIAGFTESGVLFHSNKGGH